jgi:hypothetical protein
MQHKTLYEMGLIELNITRLYEKRLAELKAFLNEGGDPNDGNISVCKKERE